MLDDVAVEDKHGMNLNMNRPAASQQNTQANAKNNQKKEPSVSEEFNGDQYDDDFDDIEEDLPVDEVQPDDIHITGIGASGQGITVSQSLGVDPSVDSLALEDYDHVEPVERLM